MRKYFMLLLAGGNSNIFPIEDVGVGRMERRSLRRIENGNSRWLKYLK